MGTIRRWSRQRDRQSPVEGGTHRHFASPSIFQLPTIDLVPHTVGGGRATAIQQPPYQSVINKNTQGLGCNLLSNFGSVGKRERGVYRVRRI